MVGIAHEPIEILLRPERAAAPESAIGFLGGIGLQRVHAPIEPVSRARCKQRMDVIGHHAPSDQHIAISIKSQERALNEFRNGWNCQITPAIPLIESGIDDRDTVVAPHLVQFFFQRGREAIRQSADDMLNEVGVIEMRKIAARAPASMRSTGRQG